MRKLLFIVALLAAAALHAQSPPAQAAGYMLAFSDNFATLSLSSGTSSGFNWYDTGFFYPTPLGIITDPSGTYVNLNWASSQVYDTNMATMSSNGTTGRAWTYGYIEISMLFNPTTGSWPALWMFGPSANSSGLGTYTGPELDIFEWNSQAPTTFTGTIHNWASGAAGTYEQVNTTPGGITYSNFNTYGVLWNQRQVCWYLNNVSQGCVSTTSSPFNSNFALPMFLLLSQQAGCNYVPSYNTPCAGQVSPLNMQVQWVHVFTPPVGGAAVKGVNKGTVIQ